MRVQLSIVAVLCAVLVLREDPRALRSDPTRPAWALGMPTQSRGGHGSVSESAGPAWAFLRPDAVPVSSWDWSWRELQTLPGIGPRRATTIVEARHFDAYAATLQAAAGGSGLPQASPAMDGAPLSAVAASRHVVAQAWRASGPELLECLPGIGPATVAALRAHWRAQRGPAPRPGGAAGSSALGAPWPEARAVVPVEYTPPPARRP